MKTVNIFNYFSLLLAVAVFSSADSNAVPKREYTCSYKDQNGLTITTASRGTIPKNYQSQARCRLILDETNTIHTFKVIPSKEELIDSFMGPVIIKWPPQIANSIATGALPAVKEAIITSESFLKSLPSSFPKLRDGFKISLIDQDNYQDKIPFASLTSCNPGWIVNANQINLLMQEMEQPCFFPSLDGLKRVTQEVTIQVLRFMGFLLDEKLIGDKKIRNTIRKEGFALWFSINATQFSKIFGDNTDFVLRFNNSVRGLKITHQANYKELFSDYIDAALIFELVSQTKGPNGIPDFYKFLNQNKGHIKDLAIKYLELKTRQELELEIDQILLPNKNIK